GVVRVNAMRREHVWAENSEFVEILHRSGAMFLATIIQFFPSLPDVNQDGCAVLSCQRRSVLQRFLRTGVNRMGRSGGVNQCVTLPALQEFFRVLEHGGV